MLRNLHCSGFRLHFLSPGRPGLRFRPISAQGSNRNSSPDCVKDFGLRSWHLRVNATPNRPPIREKILINNLGKESEPRGSHCGLAERTDVGSACWKQQSLRPGVRRWKPLPALPAGLTLAPEAARSTVFLPFSLPLQPQTGRARSQAMIRKALGAGGGRNPGSILEAAGKSRFRSSAPSRPVGGELTRSLGQFRTALGRHSSSLRAAGAVYAVRCSQRNLAHFQLRAKARAHPPRCCLEVMPIDETKK